MCQCMAWSCVTILLMHTHEMVDGDDDHDDDDDDDDGNDDYSGSPFMMAVPNMEQPLPHICICSQQQQKHQQQPQRKCHFNRNKTQKYTFCTNTNEIANSPAIQHI